MAQRSEQCVFPHKAWKGVMKVAICLPCRDMVHTSFAYDLSRMMASWAAQHVPKGDQLMIFTSKGTLIVNQRADLVRNAVNAGADYILWLDTDMRFPKDTLDRLLAHKKPIVAANYATRRLPVDTVAFQLADDGGWSTLPSSSEKTGLEKVTAVGMGVMLTDCKIYKEMEAPWFSITYHQNSHEYSGEDIYFCYKAGKMGYDILIDHDLSKEVKHVGDFEFGHEHVGIKD